MTIQRFSGNSPFEPVVGYSRAVAFGELVFLSGTTATGEDGRIVWGGVGAQTRRILQNVGDALARAGSDLAHVLALTIFVTDKSTFLDEVAPVLREAFADHPPTMTLVEVSALISPEMLVEVTTVAARAARA